MDEPITTLETMETNSLTKLRNSGYRFSPLLAKNGNYQFLSVKEMPNEGKPDSIIKKLPEEELFRDEFPEIPWKELLRELLEIPFEIKMITAAPFFHVFKQKRVELFSVSLKDVEKALKPKQIYRFGHQIAPRTSRIFWIIFSPKSKKITAA